LQNNSAKIKIQPKARVGILAQPVQARRHACEKLAKAIEMVLNIILFDYVLFIHYNDDYHHIFIATFAK
jgi:hypothetical protein